MKLEVGMWVRTDNGNIRKIVELTNTEFIDVEDYYVDKVLIDIEQNEGEDTIYMRYWLFNGEIVKSSPNIINLIEVGDYVNGYKVIDIDVELDEVVVVCLSEYDGVEQPVKKHIKEEDIKSIVTKEQFSAIEYKID